MTKEEHAKLHADLQGRSMVKLRCPSCGKVFIRERRNCFLINKTKYTCCSNVCRGKFSRLIQLQGLTKQVEDAISGNLLSEFNSLDNSEETVLQQTP